MFKTSYGKTCSEKTLTSEFYRESANFEHPFGNTQKILQKYPGTSLGVCVIPYLGNYSQKLTRKIFQKNQ